MDGIGSKTKSRNRRVLMITPRFYPCHYIGAHRTGKFAKYLPEFGFETIVVTVAPSLGGWKVDEALLNQIPKTTEIINTFYLSRERFKSFLNKFRNVFKGSNDTISNKDGGANDSNVLSVGQRLQSWVSVPDGDIFWVLWAVKASLKATRRADVIFVSAPAFSNLVIAAIIKRLTSIPLVIDLRDPWTPNLTRVFPTRLHRWVDHFMERWSFMKADAIVCNTEALRKRYCQLYPQIESSRFFVITNGYDDEDFVNLPKIPKKGDKLRLGYFGTIYAGRNPAPLFCAAKNVIDKGLIPQERLEFVFFGPSSDIVRQIAERANVSDMVSAYDSVPYAQALREMAACNILLIIGSAETDMLHIPGKTYEYMALQKPILALSKDGALSELMDYNKFGIRVDPEHPREIEEALVDLWNDFRSENANKYICTDSKRFSRRELTRKLAEILRGVIK